LPLLAALAAGCDPPGRPRPDDRPAAANQVKGFDALYANRCAGCHGADGKLGPAPPLNDPTFLAIVPDAVLLRVISEGRAVTPDQRSPMPAFARDRGGPLTGEEVKGLAAGIKKRWGPPASPAGSPPPYLAQPGAGGDKHEGARVFARACAGCHGDQGKGGDLPGGVINDQAFLALVSDQALRRIIITGRPDLGMPAYDGKAGRGSKFRPLTAGEIDDLVALLAYWRQGGSASGK
jgi:mono/diheme cytochrome c family protein